MTTKLAIDGGNPRAERALPRTRAYRRGGKGGGGRSGDDASAQSPVRGRSTMKRVVIMTDLEGDDVVSLIYR
jgi:hypothetical protein